MKKKDYEISFQDEEIKIAKSPFPKFSGKAPERDTHKRSKKLKIDRNFEPDTALDLHGETQERALEKVESVLKSSIRKGLKTVLIIPGKGLHSGPDGGILKRLVWNWLKHEEQYVKKFQWAPKFHGGEGAILVFLAIQSKVEKWRGEET